MVRITGTVGSSGKQPVTSLPVASQAHIPLKITFESNTAGSGLSLWAGSVGDFEMGSAGTNLSGSGGPGFTFLTIINVADLNGQMLWVQRDTGSGDSLFTIDIE